jgi:hypothetical protein
VTETPTPTPTTAPTDPQVLRAEIARTRAALGETAEALAAKANVKARAKESAQQAIEGVRAQVGDVVRKPLPIGVIVGVAAAIVVLVFWRRRR